MVHLKLIYFDLKARAQLTRMILNAGGVEFEDFRIAPAEWGSLKETFKPPFGQLPIMEIDGVRICQSLAVARAAARQAGLTGKSSIEEAQADMVVDCINEIFADAMDYHLHEKDPSRKEEKAAKFRDDSLPTRLAMLKNIFKDNPGDWFVGTDLTWADIAFADVCDWAETCGCTIDFKPVPELQALRNRTEAVPGIASYLANRKTTKF